MRTLGEVLHEGAGGEDGPVLAIVLQPLMDLPVGGAAGRQGRHAEEHEAANAFLCRQPQELDHPGIRVVHRRRSHEIDRRDVLKRRIPGLGRGPVERPLAAARGGAVRHALILQLRDQALAGLPCRARHEHQTAHAAPPSMKASTAADPICAFRPWIGFQ